MDEMEENIRSLSNEELIQMVRTDYEQYTDEALRIASNELNTRSLSQPEVRSILDDFSEENGDTNQPSADCTAYLTDELQYQESFDAILDFVTSMNIRCGEYEGYKTIFKKMDRENFILYTEKLRKDGNRSILGCVAIGKEELVEKINEIGDANGFIPEEPEME